MEKHMQPTTRLTIQSGNKRKEHKRTTTQNWKEYKNKTFSSSFFFFKRKREGESQKSCAQQQEEEEEENDDHRRAKERRERAVSPQSAPTIVVVC